MLENILCFYTVILSLGQIHFLISAERRNLLCGCFFAGFCVGGKVENFDNRMCVVLSVRKNRRVDRLISLDQFADFSS